jgi:hypothetical protein
MSGSNQQQQNSNQTTVSNPWAPTQGALQNAIPGLTQAYNQSTANNAATQPSGFVAQMTPQQLQTFQSMIGFGGNLSPATTALNAGTNLTGTGTTGTNAALSALEGYNPALANNPAALSSAANQMVAGENIPAQVEQLMLPQIQQAQQVTLPGIDSAAAGTGNTNSSRTGIAQGLVQQGLAEQDQSLAGALTGQAYTNALNTAENQAATNNAQALGGYTTLGGLGTNAANLGVGALGEGVNNASTLFNIAGAGGTGLQSGNQLNLNEQLAQNQWGTQNPFASMQQYLPYLESMAALGGQSQQTGSSTSTTTPSALSQIASILGAGGSILGGQNSMGGSTGLGGISGIMSLFGQK